LSLIPQTGNQATFKERVIDPNLLNYTLETAEVIHNKCDGKMIMNDG
jgi:hypothetical protein